MLERWTMAPWMRRRLARHVERGTSDRVIACLISPAPAAFPGQGLQDQTLPGRISPARRLSDATPTDEVLPGEVRRVPDLGDPSARYDLSNVILFRALAAPRPRVQNAR